MDTPIKLTCPSSLFSFDRHIRIERIMQIFFVKNRVIWRAVLQCLESQYIICPNRWCSNVDIVTMFIVVAHQFYVDSDLIGSLCWKLFGGCLLWDFAMVLVNIREDLMIPLLRIITCYT